MESIEITPFDHPVDADVEVPGSKSITNRALILAALANGRSRLTGVLESDDTRVMMESLRRLGFEIEYVPEESEATVLGCGGAIPAPGAELFVGNSGTSMRFLTALCALGRGAYSLDGVPRMRERPQGDLLDALHACGVEVRSCSGGSPLVVHGAGRLRGGSVTVRADASSQYVSAILMISPYAECDLELGVVGSMRPHYVDITLQMMASWGVAVAGTQPQLYRIPCGQGYTAQPCYHIEPDASSASYMFAAAAVTGGRVCVRGLRSDGLQGDVRFATEVLAQMGCHVTEDARGITVTGPPAGELRGIDRDMSSISDTSITLAAIAPFATTPTTIRNIAHSRLQECDRIEATVTELRRLGVRVDERPDGLTVYPATHLEPALVETYEDHRIAMSFAIAGLAWRGVRISNPACVNKTFPSFWQTLESLRRRRSGIED